MCKNSDNMQLVLEQLAAGQKQLLELLTPKQFIIGESIKPCVGNVQGTQLASEPVDILLKALKPNEAVKNLNDVVGCGDQLGNAQCKVTDGDTSSVGINKYAQAVGLTNGTEFNKPKEQSYNFPIRNGYEDLALTLIDALEQAQSGKGSIRHQVGDTPFNEQPICSLTRLYGYAYPFGQAAKKIHETSQLTDKRAKMAEILGAINYLAAAYIVMREGD